LTCAGCGNPLAGQQRKWCSDTCSKEATRAKRLASIFNLTPDEYDLILDHQGGVCAICGRPPKPGKRLAVDHDHKTGFVRGLLCFLCNRRVLGARSADVLVKTAAYVTDPPARKALGRDVVAPGRPKKKRKPRRRRAA
jgi:hypothetical protein